MAWIALVALVGCGSDPADSPANAKASTRDGVADVIAVAATGAAGAYDFAVTVHSDETGCDQYADWWEVLTPDGALVYRRILRHSHPSEQPFERSGGPVSISADDEVLVRAHLHPAGYTGAVMRGSVATGFTPAAVAPDFAEALATTPPLPDGCLF